MDFNILIFAFLLKELCLQIFKLSFFESKQAFTISTCKRLQTVQKSVPGQILSSLYEQHLPGIKGDKEFNTSFFSPFIPPQRQYQLQKSCGPLWEKYRFQNVSCILRNTIGSSLLPWHSLSLVHSRIFLKGLTVLLLPDDLPYCCLYFLSLENIREFRDTPRA